MRKAEFRRWGLVRRRNAPPYLALRRSRSRCQSPVSSRCYHPLGRGPMSPPHSGPRPEFFGLHTLLQRLSGARSLPRLDLRRSARGWCGDLGHPVSPFVSLVCHRPTSRLRVLLPPELHLAVDRLPPPFSPRPVPSRFAAG